MFYRQSLTHQCFLTETAYNMINDSFSIDTFLVINPAILIEDGGIDTIFLC